MSLKRGDRLIAFTDGIIDSLAAQRSGSAESSLISLVRNHRNCTAAQLANIIVADCENPRSGFQLDGSLIVACLDEGDVFTYNAAAMNTELALAEA